MREVNINSIRSVDRTFEILDVFTNEKPERPLDDICKETKLAKATVYRLLYTLERRGLIDYNPETLNYKLGLKFLSYSGVVSAKLDVVEESKDLLNTLQEKTKQTVIMALPQNESIVYVYKKEKNEGLIFSSFVGQRRSRRFGLLGKIFMAFSNDSIKEELLNEPFVQYTNYTIIDKNSYKKHLEQVKEKLLATDMQETSLGVNGIAVPVFNNVGHCIASIGILGPSVQLQGDELLRCEELIQNTGRMISSKMGYVLS